MNRIEAVSDVVFGFALTLLVVSIEVPRTYDQLVAAMRGFPAFALTFALLMAVWSRHYYFFRHYGLSDGVTIFLNTVLLFVVLFYVYPLKFLFYVWLAPLTGAPMALASPQGVMRPVMSYADNRGLMLIFGSGFGAVYFAFAAMYWHAYRMREALRLNKFEVAYTRTSLVAQLISCATGMLSIVVALLLRPDRAGNAGYVYLLAPLLLNINGALWRRRKRALEHEMAPQAF
jgi:hypothetical protein